MLLQYTILFHIIILLIWTNSSVERAAESENLISISNLVGSSRVEGCFKKVGKRFCARVRLFHKKGEKGKIGRDFQLHPSFLFRFSSLFSEVFKGRGPLVSKHFQYLFVLQLWDNLMPQHFQDIFVSVPFTGLFILTGEDLFFRE